MRSLFWAVCMKKNPPLSPLQGGEAPAWGLRPVWCRRSSCPLLGGAGQRQLAGVGLHRGASTVA